MRHAFCPHCVQALIKITRIKKGLTKRFEFDDAIKCPECAEILVQSKASLSELKQIIEVQEFKDKTRDQKLTLQKSSSKLDKGAQ